METTTLMVIYRGTALLLRDNNMIRVVSRQCFHKNIYAKEGWRKRKTFDTKKNYNFFIYTSHLALQKNKILNPTGEGSFVCDGLEDVNREFLFVNEDEKVEMEESIAGMILIQKDALFPLSVEGTGSELWQRAGFLN